MDKELVADLCDAIREISARSYPVVDLIRTEAALELIADRLKNAHLIIPLLDGIEDRLCEIRDELSTLSTIQEARA
jgi:hypothetical protein